MDISIALDQVYDYGFTVLDSLIEQETCQRLRESLSSTVAQHNRSLRAQSDRDMVHNCHEWSLDYLIPYQDPNINTVLSHLLGSSFIIYACQSSSLPPRGTNNARRIHCDSPRLIPGYITNIGVIIALDDYTYEAGPIEFLAGSHTHDQIPDEQMFYENSTKVICKAGSAIIFNARTFHREGINTTNQYRHSLTCNFCRCYMKQRFDFVRMAQTSGLIFEMTNEQRKLIGYNARIPVSLDDFYLPPEKRMYKPGQE